MRSFALPAGKLLVNGLAMSENIEIGGECLIDKTVVALITRADFHHGERIENIKLRHGPEIDTVYALRITGDNGVKPAATARTACSGAKFTTA